MVHKRRLVRRRLGAVAVAAVMMAAGIVPGGGSSMVEARRRKDMRMSADMSTWMSCTGIIFGSGRRARRSAIGVIPIKRSEILRRRN